MDLTPRRSRRAGLRLVWLMEMAVAIGFITLLSIAVGSAVAIPTAVISAAAPAYGARRGLRLRRIAQADPVAGSRAFDAESVRFGKLFAGFAFATMGIGVIAVIAVVATHS